jgi:hypothetical protein
VDATNGSPFPFSRVLRDPRKQTSKATCASSAEGQYRNPFKRIPDWKSGYRIKDELLRQARLAETFGKLVGIGRISERQPTEMIDVRVTWIDLHKLAPNLSGLVGATQMT